MGSPCAISWGWSPSADRIAPIAALIFASAMALSLSVEGESFFHTPLKASAEPGEAEGA